MQHFIDEACDSLMRTQLAIRDAPQVVEPVPGLYAIHAPEACWDELGLEHRKATPLYVGKSESSLVGRDLGQHFAIDPSIKTQTGSSTVRRSFAALLREPLQLHGVPRNRDKPAHFSNFGLEPEADQRLTRWMHSRLRLAVWPMPSELTLDELGVVEVGAIRKWVPPLNIRDNPAPLRRLRNARAIMAAEAKYWPGSNTVTGA
jgi:hypothetical protein